MKRLGAVSLSLALVTLTGVPAIRGAEACPPEVAKASAALKSAQASLKKSAQTATAQQDVQAPRSQAGSKSQDVQAPRGNQDVQAPRGNQDVQAPRGSQDVQAPRGNQDVQSPRVKDAGALVRQANAACKKGDMTTAAQKAKEALALLK